MSGAILLKLGLAAAFDLLHYLLLHLSVLFELLACLVVAITVLDRLGLLQTHGADPPLELFPDVLVDVIIVLVECLQGVQDFGLEA